MDPTTLDSRIRHEQQLIGCALVGGEDIRSEVAWLQPDSFHDDLWGKWWARYVAGEDGWNVAAEIGGEFYTDSVQWMADVVSQYSARTHAVQVARLAQMARRTEKVARLGQASVTGDYATYQSILQELAAEMPPAQVQVRTALDVGAAFLDVIDSPFRVIQTCIPPLDRAIAGGLERQTQSILAARPSMGKSALAFQIARNVAMREPVLFVSLEMDEINLWARAACGAAGLTWARVKANEANRSEKDRLREVTFNLMNAYGDRLMIHDEAATTESIWEMAVSRRPALVIVDHIRFIGDDSGENENKRLGRISGRMKQMAKRLDCHVMLLAQLNRKGEAEGEERPQLQHLRDSGEIEENADLVLMPWRESYNDPRKERDGKSRTEVWVRKARDGVRNAKVCLVYDLKQQWFDEPTEEEWPARERA